MTLSTRLTSSRASAGPTLFEIDIEMLRGTRRLTTHLPGDSGAAGADSFIGKPDRQSAEADASEVR